MNDRPVFWPHFSSPVRSTALSARLGRLLGIAIGICFLTGILSHYQYHPWRWLPEPASPAWGFRLTQGIHVATGTAAIPLVLIKLWSVYPNLFRWPPVRSVRHALERGSVAILVAATLVQLSTGFANALNWYPFGWDFVPVHWALAFVVLGSVLLHVGVKLPDIVYGLQTRVADGDVLSEIPWNENPVSHSNAGQVPPPPTPALSRRGVLAATGLGLGAVVITTVGQTVKPLEPLGLLAIRQPHRGPQRVPVNRTADQAQVLTSARDPGWTLRVDGPSAYALSLAEVEAMAGAQAWLPIACVEGWSALAHWSGVPLIDLVTRAGGSADSLVRVHSLEPAGFNSSEIFGPQLSAALLATHLNGERLDLDHGYPLRLIAPNRAGVLNTKWLSRLEVSS
ncbi:molybdopterin-dependent oxidoreductase [Microlunatus ginsengisoli]|uniref:Molybdopterin-dependent oxidoreductase n=1 Tax=Microlunatus ginsengisoli TaxID=363863 RepID=A0ABP6ZQ11_9ACTN